MRAVYWVVQRRGKRKNWSVDCNTNSLLVSVVSVFVVIEVDQYRVGSLILVYSCFKALDSLISWRFAKDFVGLYGYAPRSFGAFG